MYRDSALRSSMLLATLENRLQRREPARVHTSLGEATGCKVLFICVGRTAEWPIDGYLLFLCRMIDELFQHRVLGT